MTNDASEGSSLSVDSADMLTATLPPQAGSIVTVYENGRRWAAVRTNGPKTAPTMSCQLRPVGESRTTVVEVRDAAGDRLFARTGVRRSVLRNQHGLRASDVFRLNHPPLNATPWITFDGVKITIGGYHLPPAGDPSSLLLKTGPGVIGEFDYERPAPDWADVYWYWPNAGKSAFLMTIDLLASEYRSDPFHLEFFEARDSREKKLSDLRLPNDLHVFQSFTADVTKIDRVQRGIDAFSIVLPGYSSFRYLETLFRRYGIDPNAEVSFLDWGCGIGRLTSHFLRQWPRARVCGTDIDAANIAWCVSSLGSGFTACPLWPPTSFEDCTFDALIGVSVMTHLTLDAQAAWLSELARILKPDGVAMLTFAGVSGTAYGSRWRSATWWERWRASGFDAETSDASLDGFVEDGNYYRQTSQTVEHVEATWSRHFQILEIIEAAFGNQDLAVLRRCR